MATLRMTADAAGIVKGDKALLAITQTASAAEQRVTSATTAMTSSMSAVGGAAGDLSQKIDRTLRPEPFSEYSANLSEIRAKFNPLYAASMRYEGALQEIAQAERLGAISANEAAQARTRAASAMTPSIRATAAQTRGLRALASGAGGAAGGMRSLGLQLNQVAQVGGMTGNWAQALAVQLPDMLLGFGGVGIAAGIAAGAMIPLISTMASGVDEAERMSQAMDALGEAMQAMDSATDAASQGFIDLRREYGVGAEQAKALLQLERELAFVRSERALNDASTAIAEQFGGMGQMFDDMGATMQDGFLNVVRKIQSEMDLTGREAFVLANTFRALSEARGPEEVQRALVDVREQFTLAAGGARKMTTEQFALYESLLKSEDAALRLAAIDLATGFSEAADEAARIVTNTEDAIAAINRANREAYTQSRGGGRGQDPRIFMREGEFHYDGPRLDSNNNPITTARGGRSGASAEQRAAARIFENTRTALEKYNAEVAELNRLHAEGLIDAETHNRAVEMAGEKYTDLAQDAQRASQSMASGFADATASIVTGADSAGEAVARLIEQMIAMPLLERGFQTILGGFGLNFGGFRASGGPVDPSKGYIVGERGPEWFQPNTAGSIIPNGATQNVHVTVGVDGDGNIKPFVDQRAGLQVARAAPDIMGAQDRKLRDSLDNFSARRG